MEPEPWSEKDFAPIMAFLRHQIGITLEAHRMGLLAGAAALAASGQGLQQLYTVSRTGAQEPIPTGWGAQLLIDLSTVNHTAFFREPAHFTFMAEKIAGWLKESPG